MWDNSMSPITFPTLTFVCHVVDKPHSWTLVIHASWFVPTTSMYHILQDYHAANNLASSSCRLAPSHLSSMHHFVLSNPLPGIRVSASNPHGRWELNARHIAKNTRTQDLVQLATIRIFEPIDNRVRHIGGYWLQMVSHTYHTGFT